MQDPDSEALQANQVHQKLDVHARTRETGSSMRHSRSSYHCHAAMFVAALRLSLRPSVSIRSRSASKHVRSLFRSQCSSRLHSSVSPSSRLSTGPKHIHNHRQPETVPKSVYIHLPFCVQRCYYCDFAITTVGSSGTAFSPHSPTVISRFEKYVHALLDEINHTLDGMSMTSTKRSCLTSIYIGGGTPSLVPARFLSMVLELLDRRLGICSDTEITIEMDPNTFDETVANEFKLLGMNRVSIGAQSFDDALLESCGRIHRASDIYCAVDALGRVGIENVSLDLISALPYQSVQQWKHSLQQVIQLAPKHVSTYDLELHESTKFGKLYTPGVSPLPSSDDAADMYELAVTALNAHGIMHYETSNYAQRGYESQHNQTYWKNEPYFAFGMSAASYVNNKRVKRPSTLSQYYDWVTQHAFTNGTPQETPLSAQDELEETVMLGLRLVRGIDLEELECRFRGRFGGETDSVAERLVRASKEYLETGILLLECDPITDRRHLKLSDPRGFLIQNTVLRDLFLGLESLNEPNRIDE